VKGPKTLDNPKNTQGPQPKHLIATIKGWNIQRARELIHKHPGLFSLVTQPEALASKVEEIQPQYIFFPHWSWIIPKRIYEAYECVVFHMTDLPFGRGGSPLQNLISRGIHQTRISAIRTGLE